MGAADLDGDGAPETVFSDNNYRVSGFGTRGSVYVYENGSLVFSDPAAQCRVTSLGDTDGNGLGEIICFDPASGNLKVIESTGAGDDFQLVFDAPRDGYSFSVVDFNEDGVSEFWRILEDGSGGGTIFTFAHRNGGTITDFFNSGTLLQGFAGDIKNVRPIGDTNGDGNLELAVVQGNQIHILEEDSGAHQVDTDGDGVGDADDICPNTPSGAAVDAVGCPTINKMTGGGQVPTGGGRHTHSFGFNIQQSAEGWTVNFEYNDNHRGKKGPLAPLQYHANVDVRLAELITDGSVPVGLRLNFPCDKRTLDATGNVRISTVVCTVEVTDNGEPGKGTDKFMLTTDEFSPYSSNIVVDGDVLIRGNIQAHYEETD